MHFTFAASGHSRWLQTFEEYLKTRIFPMPVTMPDGSTVMQNVESALRPIQLYEFIFPKEHLDVVLNTLAKDGEDRPRGKSLGLPLAMVRKALHLKKIPKKRDPSKGKLAIIDQHVRIVPIGIRYDEDIVYPDGKRHEGL